MITLISLILRPALRMGVYTFCGIALLSVAQAYAHQLEDGFVERSVAVVVRPGEATVSYSIGANEATRRQLIDNWSANQAGPKPEAVPAMTDDVSQEDCDAFFLKTVGPAVVKGLVVEADGNALELEVVEVIPTPHHHVEATVVMRLKLPTPLAGASSITLKFHDRNFAAIADEANASESGTETASSSSQDAPMELGGAFRYAMKGAKGVMLNRSTAAPILVRAKRALVAEIPADQLEAKQQFSAEVILP